MIRLDGVEFRYGTLPVLNGLSLTIPARGVTVLAGPSGSGKSTVLRLIAGFAAPERGVVAIGDEVVSRGGRILVPPEARGVAVVFQDLALWPHMTVRDTLDFVLGRDVPAPERGRRIDEVLGSVGLERYADARPGRLSGGERQRVALARAIVTRPRILLMDEPLANLDPHLRDALVGELKQLQRRLGLTMLYVTHSREEAFALGDEAAVILAGRVEQSGPPRELYAHPASAFVATFLGRCALVRGRIRADGVESPLGLLPLPEPSPVAGPEVVVVVRPEDVRLEEGGAFGGTIESSAFTGSGFEAEISGPGWRIIAAVPDEPKRGSRVRLSIYKVAVVPLSA
jgi:ABC-type Fe3+/spermidine/putrescine transport system ATPase subunit